MDEAGLAMGLGMVEAGLGMVEVGLGMLEAGLAAEAGLAIVETGLAMAEAGLAMAEAGHVDLKTAVAIVPVTNSWTPSGAVLGRSTEWGSTFSAELRVSAVRTQSSTSSVQ